MDEPKKVLIAKEGAVTTVTINRPKVRNAVDHETGQLLKAAFLEFDADESQSVAVLSRRVKPSARVTTLSRLPRGISRTFTNLRERGLLALVVCC